MIRMNRKTISCFLLCAIILLNIAYLVSCGNDVPDDSGSNPSYNDGNVGNSPSGDNEIIDGSGDGAANEKFAVRFITDDGVPVVIKSCKRGESLNSPNPPRKMGCIFTGWIGDYTNITQNTDIIATYTDVSDIDNAISADTVYSSHSSEFDILIGVYGDVSFCGLDMDITYDGNLLELAEITDVDDCVIQNASTNGVIHMNYVSTNNTTGDVAFMNLKFRAKVTERTKTELKITVNGIYFLDDSGQLIKAEYQVLQNKIVIE